MHDYQWKRYIRTEKDFYESRREDKTVNLRVLRPEKVLFKNRLDRIKGYPYHQLYKKFTSKEVRCESSNAVRPLTHYLIFFS